MSHQELEDKLRQLTLNGGPLVVSPTHKGKNGKLEHLPFEGQLKTTLKEVSNINWKDDTAASDVFKTLFSDTLKVYEKDITSHENAGSAEVRVLQDKIASSLIVLKAIAETPLNKSDNTVREDPFWNFVIGPLVPATYRYMAQFFRYCHKNLKNCLPSPDSGSGVDEISSTSAGFARHQMLGLLQNGIRTVLVFLKRGLANLPYLETLMKDDHNWATELGPSMDSMGLVLCDILNSDGDVGLDVGCGIGLVLTGLVLDRFKGWSKESVKYFEEIYKTSSVAGTTSAASVNDNLLKIVTRTGDKDFNRICLACGFLCSVDLEESKNVELSTLMYLILKHMLEFDHGTKETLQLGTARVIEMLMIKISSLNNPTPILEKIFPLFGEIEVFVFSYIPGHIDAVKNCCRNVLAALTKIYEKIEQQEIIQPSGSSPHLIDNLLKKILSKDAHVKWIALTCVARNSPLSIKVLNLDQDLPINLLSAARSCKNPATESYVSLMSYDFPLVARSVWESRWVLPLFTTQLNQSQDSWSQKKIIIKSILKCQPSATGLQAMIHPLLKFVINRMDSTMSETAKQVTESTMLVAETIKIASELGLQVELGKTVKDKDSFRGLIPRSVLHSWLWNENPQIRLAGSFLLIETKKTTEAFLIADFESLKICLKYNVDSQSPGFRQEFISCFKKLIFRLNASQALLKRKRDLECLENYAKFFVWMWNFFTEDEGLFTGANFGRRCQSLECLANLVETFPDLSLFGVKSDNDNLKYLSWFIDSYETNKARALEVLLKIPIPAFQNEGSCQSIFEEALSLCESVKPPDSTTGRYLMVLLMKKTTLPAYSPSNILTLLLEKLEKTYAAIVATSITEVSCERPMYGVIRCIRMILTSTDNYKEDFALYRIYFEKLIPLLLKFDDILFPLLGNAAPEGFLPGLPDSSEDNNQVVRSITAQMLLVCSWRSMRDICLLFADMCALFPLEGEKQKKKCNNLTGGEYILSVAQVSLIGEHMLSLMRNLVHRGVFEQVFVGFKSLATRLWESSNPSLCALPSKWLNDAMDEEHMSSKCITRRSAGLPFIFQALLTAECDNPIFMGDWVMRLFTRDESPKNSFVRIHAMNVLRGLFRDANFSKAMMPFVPEGLRIAFRGLKSDDWTERNSGLMLFGALIRRTFGSKLNLMSAPTFFRRFPQMYDFLLGELDICLKVLNIAISPTTPTKSTAVDTDDNLTCSDFTFHLLLLLSSFAPAVRVEDEHFKLSEFIVKLRQCAACSDVEVRKLAAKAIIPFLNSPNDYSVMLNIVAEMLESGISKLSINHVHGNLIQMAVIMKYITKDNSEIIIQALSELLTPSYFSSINCPSVFEAVADVILAFEDFEHATLRKIFNMLLHSYYTRFDTSRITVRNIIPGLLLADATVSKGEILFTLSAVCNSVTDSNSGNLLFDTVYHWLISYRNATFLEQLLEHLCSEPTGLVDRLFNASGPYARILLQTLISCYCKLNISYSGQSELELRLLRLLTKINEDAFENCLRENRELMSQFLNRLINISTGSSATTEHQRQAMICLCRLSFRTGIDIKVKQMELLCTTLIAWTDSTMDDDLRFGAALGVPLSSSFLRLSVLNQCKLWLAIINLTQDDDSEIRSIVNAKVLSHSSSELAVCDRKSLESLVSCFFENPVKTYPLAALTLLMGLLFKDDFDITPEEANDDNDHEARIFDKSELNMFHEPIILAKVIKEYIISRNLAKFYKPVFDEVLTPELIELYELASNSKLFICSPTLSSLVNMIKMRLNSDQMESNADSDGCDDVCSVNISTMHAVQSQILNLVTESFL